MDRLALAQHLQECLFAHPQAGPIPVPASLLTEVMEALRFPERHEEPTTPAEIQARIGVLRNEIMRLTFKITGSPVGGVTAPVSRCVHGDPDCHCRES